MKLAFSGINNPPRHDARGIAVGLFLGLAVPIGVQMVLLGFLRTLFRFNSMLAFGATWINNPLTIIPMYYGFYRLGAGVIGENAILSPEDFRSLMTPVLTAGYFWRSAGEFAYLGVDMLLCWLIGAVLAGSVSAVLGYVIVYHCKKTRCIRKAEELGITYEKLASALEEALRKRRAESG